MADRWGDLVAGDTVWVLSSGGEPVAHTVTAVGDPDANGRVPVWVDGGIADPGVPYRQYPDTPLYTPEAP